MTDQNDTRPIPPDEPQVLSTTDARQGYRGLRVLWILIISLGLCAVMGLVLLAMRAAGVF